MTPEQLNEARAVFRPEPRTNVKSVRHINYTCGPERYAELERIAKRSRISLKELLRQMVEFALQHTPEEHPNG